jgi:hypothetical protein
LVAFLCLSLLASVAKRARLGPKTAAFFSLSVGPPFVCLEAGLPPNKIKVQASQASNRWPRF